MPLPDSPDPGPGHRLAIKLLVPVVVLLAAVVLVFYVFFSSAVVVGPSMLPTLRNADYLLITHGASHLKRGDIVVTDVAETGGPVQLVKRVIGLPGDVVEVRKDVAYVNGQPEPWRGQAVQPGFSTDVPPVTIPAGRIYVMGDNRAVSEDSRYLGPVPMSGVKGRAAAIFAPLNRIRILQ